MFVERFDNQGFVELFTVAATTAVTAVAEVAAVVSATTTAVKAEAAEAVNFPTTKYLQIANICSEILAAKLNV